MTKIPEIPANLSVNIQTPEELQKAQEELEKAQKKIDELAAKIQGYTDVLENLSLTYSIDDKLKQKIIKEVVDPFIKPSCRGMELYLLQLNILLNIYLLGLNLPKIPAIPDAIKLALGIKINLIPPLPTVAEFKQYIIKKILESKRNCQALTGKLQQDRANREKSPFSNRKRQLNSEKSLLKAPVSTLGKGPKYIPTEEDLLTLEELSKVCCDNCNDEE